MVQADNIWPSVSPGWFKMLINCIPGNGSGFDLVMLDGAGRVL